MMPTSSRRRFLALSAAAGAAPLVLPSRVLGLGQETAPSNKVRLACIGVGGMGTGNLRTFLNDKRVQVVAVCDVDDHHRAAAAELAGLKDGDSTRDFQEVLARSDVDAVMIAVPDHWHAVIAVAAAAAGKDLYAEKPLAASIGEGRALCEAVKQHQRVLQCGTWRRSSLKTRLACEWVRNGYIGEIQQIEVGVPGQFRIRDGYTGEEKPETPPAHFDYERWLGPAPEAPYTPARCHYNFRWVNDYAPGYITDWGVHFLDVVQWGANKDDTGPLAIKAENIARRPAGIYNAPESFRIEYQYADGLRVIMTSTTDEKAWGIKFVGTKGWIFTENDRLEFGPDDLHKVKFKDSDERLFVSNQHHRNFIDAVLSRGRTAAGPESSQRAATLSHLGAISAALGRPLTFDPLTESFPDDEEANALVTRPLRGPWSLKA